MLYRFPDTATYWWKVANISYTPVHRIFAPSAITMSEFRSSVWFMMHDAWGYQVMKDFQRYSMPFMPNRDRRTDGRTGRQTPCDSIVRDMHSITL